MRAKICSGNSFAVKMCCRSRGEKYVHDHLLATEERIANEFARAQGDL